MNEDFKKNSLVENYNRIIRAKNQRLNEHGYYLGSSPITEDGNNPVNSGNLVDYIMKYEGGDITGEEYLQLFSYLVKTGQAWQLQGSLYGRPAKELIDNGYLDRRGKILKSLDDVDEGVNEAGGNGKIVVSVDIDRLANEIVKLAGTDIDNLESMWTDLFTEAMENLYGIEGMVSEKIGAFKNKSPKLDPSRYKWDDPID